MKPGFQRLRAPWNPGFILFRSLAPGAPPSSEPPAPARARSSRSALTHPSGTGGLLPLRLNSPMSIQPTESRPAAPWFP
jgi:hypothetical protein